MPSSAALGFAEYFRPKENPSIGALFVPQKPEIGQYGLSTEALNCISHLERGVNRVDRSAYRAEGANRERGVFLISHDDWSGLGKVPEEAEATPGAPQIFADGEMEYGRFLLFLKSGYKVHAPIIEGYRSVVSESDRIVESDRGGYELMIAGEGRAALAFDFGRTSAKAELAEEGRGIKLMVPALGRYGGEPVAPSDRGLITRTYKVTGATVYQSNGLTCFWLRVPTPILPPLRMTRLPMRAKRCCNHYLLRQTSRIFCF